MQNTSENISIYERKWIEKFLLVNKSEYLDEKFLERIIVKYLREKKV